MNSRFMVKLTNLAVHDIEVRNSIKAGFSVHDVLTKWASALSERIGLALAFGFGLELVLELG